MICATTAFEPLCLLEVFRTRLREHQRQVLFVPKTRLRQALFGHALRRLTPTCAMGETVLAIAWVLREIWVWHSLTAGRRL